MHAVLTTPFAAPTLGGVVAGGTRLDPTPPAATIVDLVTRVDAIPIPYDDPLEDAKALAASVRKRGFLVGQDNL